MMPFTAIPMLRHLALSPPRALTMIWLSACLSSAPPDTSAHPDRNVLIPAELADQHFANAYEAIEALRSNWLQARGPDSFTNPSVVLVYFDNVRLGTVETLRALDLKVLGRIEHLDGIAATARWGVGHSAGVILVTTLAPRPTTP